VRGLRVAKVERHRGISVAFPLLRPLKHDPEKACPRKGGMDTRLRKRSRSAPAARIIGRELQSSVPGGRKSRPFGVFFGTCFLSRPVFKIVDESTY
jgi:hypothetical protein